MDQKTILLIGVAGLGALYLMQQKNNPQPYYPPGSYPPTVQQPQPPQQPTKAQTIASTVQSGVNFLKDAFSLFTPPTYAPTTPTITPVQLNKDLIPKL